MEIILLFYYEFYIYWFKELVFLFLFIIFFRISVESDILDSSNFYV